MKIVILTWTIVLCCVSALAQGTLDFANIGIVLNAPVSYYDLERLRGTDWIAQLWYGPAGSSENNLVAHPGVATFSTVPAQAGYFMGGSRTLNGIAGGATAVVQVRVWNAAAGNTWAEAIASPSGICICGGSGLLNVRLGTHPETPPPLAGLQPFQVQRFKYDYVVSDGRVIIAGFSGLIGWLEIPSTIANLPVTDIGEFAFLGNTSLTRITIPRSVTNIGSFAFYQCAGLTDILIPNSVTSIGAYAFSECTSLASIIIPNGVTRISDYTFLRCRSLSQLSILDTVTFIGTGAFFECSSLASITIPNSVTEMGPAVFGGCSNLVHATLPSNLAHLHERTFENCTSLATIVIPSGVTNVPAQTFNGCKSLYLVTVAASVRSIETAAFDGCTGLAGVYFEGDAPLVSGAPLAGATNCTVYYRPGSLGWGDTFSGRPTAPWLPSIRPTILTGSPDFGIRNNHFGFTIFWSPGNAVVVEASTSLDGPAWVPWSTNTITGSMAYFSDPEPANFPNRFYRVRAE